MVIICNRQRKLEVTDLTKQVITKAVDAVLKQQKFNHETEVSVVLTNNLGIRRLNKDYRNIDKPTDVLSFPMLEDENGDTVSAECGDFNIENDRVMLGDIVISLERAKEQSIEYGHSFEREIGFLTVHGMLHLLGFDHIDEDEINIMRKYEEEALESMGLKR